MNTAWFHLTSIPPAGERVTLDARESRHARSARRLAEGQTITVFDGCGCIAPAIIGDTSGRAIEIELGESHLEPPLTPEIHLAVALPKGDRQSVMLNMLTQLGMASLTPLLCERSIVKPGRGFTDRGARICLEACKQSHNPRLPVLREPTELSNVLEAHSAIGSALIVAHPRGGPVNERLEQCANVNTITVLIGPEGGFTDDEVAEMQESNAVAVDLGRRILRTETAAVALTSLLRLSLPGR